MKTFIQKISLIVFLALTGLILNAQTISVAISISVYSQTLANGGSLNTTIVSNLNNYLPGTITVTNNGSSPLILNGGTSPYIMLSGTSPADFSVTPQTAFSGTIAAGASQIFSVDLGTGATNGTNKTLTFTIKSNDSNTPTYTGSVVYNFSGLTTTATVNAVDIGLSLYPNPSTNGGTFSILSPNVNVNRIVVSNSTGVSEQFYSNTSFTTTLKGLLLVQLYTDNGLVYDKVIVQ